MTSAESHPFSNDPLKSLVAASAVVVFALNIPIAEAIWISPSCMFLLPMPTLVRDRQSINRMVPADNA